MHKRVAHYIESNQLLTPDSHVLTALSGGADSVALLAILCRLGYRCIAAHCNFQLRGEESDRDEQFVRHLCRQMNIPLHVQSFNTRAYAAEKSISIEMAARELRYDWFERLRLETGCDAIAVAHHKNDQAETLLLNLMRGTGLRGLCGMQARNGHIIRPLLCSRRDEIDAWLTLNRLPHIEDSTNTDTSFRRNAIRARLRDCTEAEIDNIAALAKRMQGYRRLVEEYTAPLRHPAAISIPRLMQSAAPDTLLYELLRDYDFTQTDEIFRSLTGESGRRFFSSTHMAVKDRDELLILPLCDGESSTPTISTAIRSTTPSISYPPADAPTLFADQQILSRKLTLRHWQEGDWFCPIGMHGKRKKLSDFFTDIKLPLPDKEKIWLLCADNDIVWIVGYRMDDRFKVHNGATEYVEITLNPSSLCNTSES
ncbi:MAG: tRNA lysidine(34) synthetase TilS [Paludibacteraceae bacterium]|nr:tRNA lysidine(34) synthetase TilS [Paludibacteraceae bacterium]